MAQGRRPRAVLKTEGTVFPYTDRPRPVNNVFIFFCNFGGGTRRIDLRTVCKQSFYVRYFLRSKLVKIIKLLRKSRWQTVGIKDRLTIKQY